MASLRAICSIQDSSVFFRVAYLVHYANALAAVGIDRLIERYGEEMASIANTTSGAGCPACLRWPRPTARAACPPSAPRAPAYLIGEVAHAAAYPIALLSRR